MLKIFAPKVVDRVHIYSLKNPNTEQNLRQAKGVMNNYLRDKHFSVDISQNPEYKNYLDVEGIADSKKVSCRVSIKEDEEQPVLRKIYKTLEMFAKDYCVNTKK